MIHQQRDILFSFSQGRQDDGKGVQANIEVFPEFSVLDKLLQVFARGCNDADITADRTRASKPVKFFFLQEPQDFSLGMDWHFPYFIQEEGAALCHLELAFFKGNRPERASTFMTEQFSFQGLFWDGHTIKPDVRSLLSCTMIMNAPGDQILAGTAFSVDQDNRICWSHFEDLVEN